MEREDLLRERRSDRFDHISDPDASTTTIALRSMASALSDVWYRLVDGDACALPLAVIFSIVGIGATADAFSSGVPPLAGALNVVTGVGFLTMAGAAVRRPRGLDRMWLLPGLLLASAGTMGGAFLLPSGSGVFGWFAKTALAALAIGLAIVAGSLVRPQTNRRWLVRGGVVIWGGALVMAVGQVGWVVVAAPVYSTRVSSLAVAAACVVGAAVIARLRNVPIFA